MVRQDSFDGEQCDFLALAIRLEAASFARCFDLDPTLVLRVCERTLCDADGNRLPETRRVNECLAEEFYEDVIVCQRVKRTLAHLFGIQAEDFPGCSMGYAERTSSLPGVDYGPVSVGHVVRSDRLKGCRFVKEGQQWSLFYEGKHISLSDTDGMTYIAYLLEHPKKDIHVRDLYCIAHPPPRAQQTSIEDLSEECLSPERGGSRTDRRDDAELLAHCRASRDQLLRELERARRNGDPDADDLQTRLDDLNRVMSAEYGLDGRPRLPGDKNKLAYDRVSRPIKAVRKKIAEYHPSLALHLDNSIHYETFTYIYTPEPAIDWDT